MRSEIMQTLKEALNDAFDPEYGKLQTLHAIRWDSVSHILSFQGATDCINVCFDRSDNGDCDVVVEFSNQQTLWERKI